MRLEDAASAPRREFDGTAIRVVQRAALDAKATEYLRFAPGTRVIDAIRARTPSLTDEDRKRLRVVFFKDGHEETLELWRWEKKLRPGDFLLITDRPMRNGLRTILQVVISVAALTIGTIIGGPFGAAAAAALAFGGNLLLNQLIPLRGPKDNKPSPTYSVNGFQNRPNVDGVIPMPVGVRHRFAPPYAVPPYISIVNDKVELTAVFCCGFAPMARWNEKIGDRSLDRFKFFETEYRGFVDGAGLVDNTPFEMVRETVIQKALQIEIRNKEDGPKEGDKAFDAEPTVVETAPDTRRCKAILSFPEGLADRSKKKGKLKSRSVSFRIRKRIITPANNAAWTTIETAWTVSRKASRSFFVEWEHDFGAANRGAYEIEFVRTTADDANERERSRVELIAFQSILPEYALKREKLAA